MPPPKLIPKASYSAWFSMSRVVSDPVFRRFLFASTAFSVDAMTAPVRSVLPLTVTSKPSSPALIPAWSTTLAKSLLIC